jgi:uncharacterized protein (TIGR03437 family)
VIKIDGTTASVIAGTGAPGYTGDGAAAVKATLFLPYGVAADTSGNVYIADYGNNAIRQVDSKGNISTIAGGGKPGFSGDKGLALGAQFAGVASVQVDGSGNLNVSDQGNQRIRQLQLRQVQPDVSISIDNASRSVNHGNPASFTLTLTSIGGYAGTASVAVSGAGGLTFQFNPSVPVTLTAGQNVLITATTQIPSAATPAAVNLTFSLTAGAIQHSVPATLNITNLPQIPVASIVSSASGIGGGVSPGEIIALYGQDLGPADIALGAFDSSGILSTQVGNTQVLFDGKPAPILYSLGGQVSAIVPYSVAGNATTQVQVVYNGQKSAPATVNVVEAAPALFNIPGSSQAVAQYADYSLNNSSNPAAPGTVVVLYGTGEGVTNPGGVDGKQATTVFPAPALQVTVSIGGQQAEVLYAGAAPFLVAGVMQLNVRIPDGTPSGPAAVVVTVGTRKSTGTSTVAVK